MATTDRQRYRMTLSQQRHERLIATGVPVPFRITTALDMLGLYGPEVDQALGVEEPTVDMWESGELVPTREQVEALARLTEYPAWVFYLPASESDRWGFMCSGDETEGICEQVWLGPPAPDARTGADS
jgi:hypothetical protein